MNNKIIKTIIWLSIFSISLAFMETAVVVYLRKLYYPDGFSFPLKIIDLDVAITEFFREIATIIILGSAGILVGRKNIEKFAVFIFCFAVWDIFYYVFLKITLNWPDSLLTWDILFMVPVTWVGPVIAPVINSITMIVLAGCIIYYTEKNGIVSIGKTIWVLLITGSFVIIFGYTQEYLHYMMVKFSITEIFGISNNKEVLKYACSFIPMHFNWVIFGIGELMHITAIFIFRRSIQKNPCRINDRDKF